MKNIFIIFSIIFISIITPSCRWVNDADDTAFNEFKPSELLKKYEWFKDAAAQEDSKIATLKSYEARFASIKQGYGADSTNRGKWIRTDVEQWNIWQSEFLGIKASYNDLAAEYNAAMAKFNYRFCNTGDLPAGETKVLPREYRQYINY